MGSRNEQRRHPSLPHLADRNLKLPIEVAQLPDGAGCEILNAGFSLSGDGPGVSAPPPRLDEHRAEILDWLGLATPAEQPA